MLKSETTECIKLIVELFPSAELTAAELDLFRSEMEKYTLRDALNAARSRGVGGGWDRPLASAVTA